MNRPDIAHGLHDISKQEQVLARRHWMAAVEKFAAGSLKRRCEESRRSAKQWHCMGDLPKAE